MEPDERENVEEAKRPLHWAALFGEVDELEKHIAAGQSVNAYRAYPIVVPGFAKLPGVTKKFIVPVPGRKKTHTPLHVAVNQEQVLAVKYLLLNGADMNLRTKDDRNETAMEMALRKRDYFIIKALEDHQAKIAPPIPPRPLHHQPSSVPSVASSQPASVPVEAAAEEPNLCNICMERAINTVILECGHSSLCLECATPLKECPICRAPVARIVKIFTTQL